MNTSNKATIALLSTVVLWSVLVVIARGIVSVVSPITVLFFRLLIASVCFLPIIIKNRVWEKPHFKKLALVSLASTINLTFFIIGIKYTSATASQIIYATMPILILIINRFFKKEKQSLNKITGVIIGFLGLIFIGYLSAVEKGETVSGSLYGNVLIMIAMLGWTSYLIFSKKLSQYFLPIEMGGISIIVSFIITSVVFLINQNIEKSPILFNSSIVLAYIYIGFAGTFLTYILFQYAVKHSSSLKVSLTSYIQPVTTAFLAIIFLGEKMTFNFILGSLLIMSGVFLTSSTSFNLIKKTLGIS